MMDGATSDGREPEIASRFSRIERPGAVDFYSRWSEKLNEQRPGKATENRQRALSGAYLTAAKLWMGITIAVLFPGIIIRLFNPDVFIVLLCIGCVPLAIFIVRIVQGFRLFPHLSITWESPADQVRHTER